jgi:adenosine deaminase
MSPESAMEAYLAALPYKNMIVGMGLDSDELDRPPSLFEEVFKRAKADGFKLTAHCDFNQKDTHKHIRQVAELLGAQRIDHGLNAADSEQLMELIASEGMGMTICPCAYIRHAGDVEVFPRIRRLFDAGIKAAIASDDPAYMEDNWVTNVLLMVKDKCNFSNHDIALLQLNAVEMSWADEGTKEELMKEIRHFVIFADADAESLRRSTMIGFFQWLKLRLLNEN